MSDHDPVRLLDGGPARVHVQGLRKSYAGRPVVTDLSLEVGAGEVVALVGPNGVGKTTLLRCLLGTESSDAGTVTLDGAPLRDQDPEVRRAVCAILDDAGAAVTQGERGEVCIRSICNFIGYWNRPEATAACMTADGFFRTGDIG